MGHKNQTMKVQDMEKGAWGAVNFRRVRVYVLRKVQKVVSKNQTTKVHTGYGKGGVGGR